MFDEKLGSLTPKQDAFACAYVETGNASEAYRRAYDVAPDSKPNTVEKRACELLKNGKVTGRVEQLQAAHAERHKITVDRLTEELENARLVAMAERQPAAAVSAIMAKAKLHGLLKNTPDANPIVPPSAPAPIINVCLSREEPRGS